MKDDKKKAQVVDEPAKATGVGLGPKPTVGRIVHFYNYGPLGSEKPEIRAAIVTKVAEDGKVGLAIFTPTGSIFQDRIEYSPEPMAGYWTWPPKV